MAEGCASAPITKTSNTLKHSEKKKTQDDKLKDLKKELVDGLNKVDLLIELSENLKFKSGDFVYHKEFGNCIIMDKFVSTSDINPMNDMSDPDNGVQVGYKIMGPNIYAYSMIVAEKDLVPANKTTKVLYNNK